MSTVGPFRPFSSTKAEVSVVATVSIVVIIVIILAFITYRIWNHHKIEIRDRLLEGGDVSKETNFFRESYMIGADSNCLPESIRQLCLPIWPQVGVISNYLLMKIPLSSFVYSEKTDGIHANLLIHEGKIYNVTNIKEIRHIGDCECKSTLILDTEEYENKYFIFDVYVVDGNVIGDKFFIERMAAVEPYLDSLGDKFVIKTFKPVPSIEFLIEYIKHDVSPDTGNEIDGVILQRTDTPYNSDRDVYVYKMKPASLMTTDLLMKYQEETKSYKLYTSGSYKSYFDAPTSRPRQEDYVYDLEGHVFERKKLQRFPEKMLILFDTPYYPNLGVYEVSETWNSKGFFKRNIDAADQIISNLIRYPDSLDNKIVEMALTEDRKWIPIRVRTDKVKPNGLLTGLSCVGAVFDPIRPLDEIYFQKGAAMESAKQTFVHELNGIFRKYIIEAHINPIGRFATVIDLCGGRGADTFDLYSNGATNLFAIDSDSTALRQYVDRCMNVKFMHKKGEYKPLLRSFRNNVNEKGNPISVNVLKHELGKSYTEVMQDLKSRFEWRGSCRVVLMNFAIHYLCTSQANIDALAKFVKNVLDDRGLFIFTYFEGNSIVEKAEKNDAKIGPFNIKIRQVRRVIHAKMPLVTFRNAKSEAYVEEPLVTDESLTKLDTYLDKIEDYNVYDKCKRWADKLVRNDEFKQLLEYYKLIHVRVYRKK